MFWFLAPIAFGLDIAKTIPVTGSARTVPITQVVIHATGGPACDPAVAFKGGTFTQMVDLFSAPGAAVSIHYIVGSDGKIASLVPETRVAWHAKGHNLDSIGIELVNNGDGVDPFEPEQVEAVTALVVDILKRRQLEVGAVTTHTAIDDRWFDCVASGTGPPVEQDRPSGEGQKRKVDPGDAFPWDTFRAEVATRLGS